MRGKREEPRLYDLAADPGEATDLAAKHPERAKGLLEAYEAWAKGLPAPLWMNTKDD